METLTLTIVPWIGAKRTVTDTPEAIGTIGHDTVDDRMIRSAYVDFENERHWFKRDGEFTVKVSRITRHKRTP